jgi:hypothetical protein
MSSRTQSIPAEGGWPFSLIGMVQSTWSKYSDMAVDFVVGTAVVRSKAWRYYMKRRQEALRPGEMRRNKRAKAIKAQRRAQEQA